MLSLTDQARIRVRFGVIHTEFNCPTEKGIALNRGIIQINDKRPRRYWVAMTILCRKTRDALSQGGVVSPVEMKWLMALTGQRSK